MHFLEPCRLLADEGFMGGLRIAFRMTSNPGLGQRILAMRRLFNKYAEYLAGVSLVGQRERVAA